MLDDATKKLIYDNYQHGHSPQVIARTYRCSVEEVLHIIGQDDLLSVQTPGDMIDQSEAGNAQLNHGTSHRVSYDAS